VREVAFTVDYEPGCNAVADALADHPDATVRSLSLHVTETSLWRVDYATGSDDALAAIEGAFRRGNYYADCLLPENCGATERTEVLDDGAALVLYSYWERTPTCASVPHLALEHLGEGVLFETRRAGRSYRWRVLHDVGEVRAFLDAVDAAVAHTGDITVHRVTDAGPPEGRSPELSDEQERTLRAAVDHGYYETPRAVDAGELAELLDSPRSTVTHRLRRAEAALATRHVGDPSDETPDRS
jgi:predicted DNA binding protein